MKRSVTFAVIAPLALLLLADRSDAQQVPPPSAPQPVAPYPLPPPPPPWAPPVYGPPADGPPVYGPPAAVTGPSPRPIAAPVRARAVAQVVKVKGGWVYLRSDTPLRPGDAFLIKSQRPVKVPDPVSGETRLLPSNHPAGTVVVEHAQGGAGAGRLLRGSLAEAGDVAVPTEAVRENLLTPQLYRGMTRVATTVRPFLAIGELGGGVLTHLLVEHYFRAIPLKIGVELAPAGFVRIERGTGAVADVYAKLGFSSSYFELTLDPGGQFQGNGERSHFLLGYSLRLGSLDGLNLIFQNAYRISEGYSYDYGDSARRKSQFTFASAQGEINVPIIRRLSLQLAGGGSHTWFFGTIGAKTYLRGGGGPGTIVLTGGVGAAGIMEENYNRGVSAYGPLLALGIDFRF